MPSDHVEEVALWRYTVIAEAASPRLGPRERGHLVRGIAARAPQIADILAVRHGVRISPRTITDRLRRLGLQREALLGETRAYGRYEAAHPNERWIGGVLVGPYAPRAAGGRGSSCSSTITVGCSCTGAG